MILVVAATEPELAGAAGAETLVCGIGPVEAAAVTARSLAERRPDALLSEYPEAKLVVRVAATEVFPNCPRYIHEYRLVQRSRFVPKSECDTPVPQWKRSEWAHDVLPAADPAHDPTREVLPRG